MTVVKLRHEFHSNDDAVVLGDVPLSDLDAFYEKFKYERILYDGEEYQVLFRDFVVDKGEAYLVIGWGQEDELE